MVEKKLKKKSDDKVFYYVAFAFPILQFLIFYAYVNFNSILLAFKEYDPMGNTFNIVWFKNIVQVIKDFFVVTELGISFKNSIVFYALNTIIGTTLTLFFSYYIFKKRVGASFFKIILFLPSIISNIVFVVLFTYTSEKLIPEFYRLITGVRMAGFLENTNTTLGTIYFFNIWSSFGMGILMYSGAMSGISDSVMEAAKLDGANFFDEFFKIVLPAIYPTFVTFMIMSVGGMFTTQIAVYSFYGKGAEYRLYNVGYYLFMKTAHSSTAGYPYLAAMGIVLTLICAPLTFGVKKFLEKIGPSIE